MKTAILNLLFLLLVLSIQAQTGANDPTFNPGTGANNDIQTMALQSDGKIIIGGSFTNYNGTARNYIARINTDGSIDATFNPGIGANNAVYTTAIQTDGKIIIGGMFTSYNGTARNYIARLNSDGTIDATFNSGAGPNNTVYNVAVQSDGNIIIGGDFTSYAGTARNRIARITSAGALDASFNPGTGTNSTVKSIAIQTDGKIVIAGWYTSFNSTPRNYIARLNSNGSLDGTFNPGTGAFSGINSVSIQSDGKIIIGGNFTSYDGTTINRIARLNSGGGLDGTFNIGTGANNQVQTVKVQSDGKIILGGNFTSFNGITRNYIARINTDGSLDTGFDPGTGADYWVFASAIQVDEKILIGGYFNNYNGAGRNRIARIITATCTDPDVPTLSASPSTLCTLGSSTLSITGNLNDATAWQIYDSSCGGTLVGSTVSSSYVVSPTSTITYYIRGEGGCITPGSCSSVKVTVGDIVAPVPDIATLPDITDECSVSSLTAPTATDNCASSVTVTNDATFPITTQGTTVVTWTYDDGNGNTSQQTQNVIIDDVTPPIPDNNTLSDITAECSVTSLTPPTATDACASSVTVTNNASLPITTQGTTVVTWTYNDGNGNSSQQTQNIIIDDVTPPTPDVTTLSVIAAECSVTSLIAPTATDNCAGTVSVTNDATLPINSSETVTWTYDDGNGNTSQQTQNIVINDVTAPVPDNASLTNVTSECEVSSLVAPTATDNCAGSVLVTNDATLPITSQGTTVVTWTYDDGKGNTSQQTQNIIIDDITAPVPDNQAILGDITITIIAQSTNQDEISWTLFDVDFNTIASGGNYPATTIGSIVDVVVVQSGNGPYTFFGEAQGYFNDNQFNFVVECEGTIVKTGFIDNGLTGFFNNIATCLLSTGLSDVIAECEVTPTPPTATDNCAGTITGTTTSIFPVANQGTAVVTWTFDDGNGNISQQTQNVIVDDITPPTILCPNDTVVCNPIVNYYEPWGIDNCMGETTIQTLGLGSGSNFPIGITTEQYKVTDIGGNIATCSFTITVNPAPVVDLGLNDTICQWDGFTLDAGNPGLNYLWSDNSTNQTYDILPFSLSPGINTISVTVTDGTCETTDEIDIIVMICSGISNVSDNLNIKIYPNPTTDLLNIECSGLNEDITITIIDISGKKVLTETFSTKTHHIQFDLDNLPSGIYAIKTETGKTSRIDKIVLQ